MVIESSAARRSFRGLSNFFRFGLASSAHVDSLSPTHIPEAENLAFQTAYYHVFASRNQPSLPSIPLVKSTVNSNTFECVLIQLCHVDGDAQPCVHDEPGLAGSPDQKASSAGPIEEDPGCEGQKTRVKGAQGYL